MKTCIYRLGLGSLAVLALCTQAWGYGGFRAGGFRVGGAGGFRAGGVAGYHVGGYGGYRAGGYAGYHAGGYGGYRAGGVAGYGGYRAGGYGGYRVGGYEGYRAGGYGGYRVGGYGGYGGYRVGGYGGYAAVGGARYGAAGYRFPTDVGLGSYSALNVARVGAVTPLWSHEYLADRAGYVRGGFYNYNVFDRGWYGTYPQAWRPTYWVAPGAVYPAWATATWPTLAMWCNVPVTPLFYDYGSNLVYQNNNVYFNGEEVGTAEAYARQATELARQGEEAKPEKTQKWQSLGVFALAQGDEKTSNTLFQLAIDQEGIIRGNYYDALTQASTPVSGSVDKKTQRAAWIIGDKKDTIFEAGLYNLTKDETPVLVHIGKDKTQQWLLVRMEQPKDMGQPKESN
jgi:hypothetical protein